MQKTPAGMIAQLVIAYIDGTCEKIFSDESWHCFESFVRFSETYDGKIYDATFQPNFQGNVISFDDPTHALISQQGEEIQEQDQLLRYEITTPTDAVIIINGTAHYGYDGT